MIPQFSDDVILAARPARNAVDHARPYAFFVEPERTEAGTIEDVATVFLTNRECPFRCLMCDLWKNTLTETTPGGAIPAQMDFALKQLPAARHLKLYNSGNFFDPRAIPVEDYPAILDRIRAGKFRSLIVENHPRLCGARLFEFHHQLQDGGIELEVALGLETVHPEVLPALNKQMTLDDFARAADSLTSAGIRLRTFILLKPPFLNEREGIEWALKSVDFAFEHGVSCCAVIPTRDGNGMIERLAAEGHYAPPRLSSMEATLARGMERRRGRVFMDVWDAERFCDCSECAAARIERLAKMNLTQVIEPPVLCTKCGANGSGE